MDPQPNGITEKVAESIQFPDGEGDALIPQQAVKRVQSKRCSLIWKITLLLCPYLFSILFLTMFASITYFYFLSAPIVAILNALPATPSVVIDLKEISSSLYQNGSNGNVSVQEANEHYSYSYSNYLFTLPLNSTDCSLSFCLLEDDTEPDYYELYSITSNSYGCIAYLSGNHTSTDDTIGMSKVSFAPQILNNMFIGINLDKTLSCNQLPDKLCDFTLVKNETEATHQFLTGLYQIHGQVNVSLPHYSYSKPCKRIQPENSISDTSRVLIEPTVHISLSDCLVVVSTKTDLRISIPFFVSAFFIILLLTTCDFFSWIFKRLLKKKFD